MEKNTDSIPELEIQISLIEFIYDFKNAECIKLLDLELAEDVFFEEYSAGIRLDTIKDVQEVLSHLSDSESISAIKKNKVRDFCNQKFNFPFGLFGG